LTTEEKSRKVVAVVVDFENYFLLCLDDSKGSKNVSKYENNNSV
jgi:hypothetical protein